MFVLKMRGNPRIFRKLRVVWKNSYCALQKGYKLVEMWQYFGKASTFIKVTTSWYWKNINRNFLRYLKTHLTHPELGVIVIWNCLKIQLNILNKFLDFLKLFENGNFKLFNFFLVILICEMLQYSCANTYKKLRKSSNGCKFPLNAKNRL